MRHYGACRYYTQFARDIADPQSPANNDRLLGVLFVKKNLTRILHPLTHVRNPNGH